MALPPQFLDELRARTPLAPLIGRKTRLVRNGRNWKGCCPFHNEKTPSFYVYDDHFHCFGCGAHGDAVSFVMRADGASFPEAVERLAQEAGLEVPQPTPQAKAREQKARDLSGVLALAASWFQHQLFQADGAEGLAYFRRRGLTDDTIRHFGLGWSGPGRGALLAALQAEGVTLAQLVEGGLMRPAEDGREAREFYFNRVMFPIRDRRGRPISFGGRILGDGQPKYLNGPETPLFHKRRALYALSEAREAAFRGAPVLVVEGYMDVIALHQAGFNGAVAPLGTALTAEQLAEIWRLSPDPVLCFDGDAAGTRAAARAAELALPLLEGENRLRLATLPAGEDPDSLVTKGGASGFQPVIDTARRLDEALYGLLAEQFPGDAPHQRAALRHRMDAVIAAIPDKALASEYRRALLDRFFAATKRPAFSKGGRGGNGGGGHGGGQLPRRPLAPPPRPPIELEQVRLERARCLLAILLVHPHLLPDLEEALATVDLPAGEAFALREGLLQWLGSAQALDSAGLMDHLACCGLASAAAWALRPAGLPEAARAEAQPKEALDGWWELFVRLRGEAELLADKAAAERDLVATNDPGAQLRLIRIIQALAAYRCGAIDDDGSGEEAGGAPGAAASHGVGSATAR